MGDQRRPELVLRHKLATRVAAAATLALAVWYAQGDPDPRGLVFVAMGAAALAASLRGLIVVRDDGVYQRGLVGWKATPLLLEELTAVSLRREAQARHFPLVLRLTGRAEAEEVSIECWAWGRWRELAHRAGHFARQLDARCDEVTGARLACARPACPWDAHVAGVLAGRRAGPPPRSEVADLSGLQMAGVVAGIFAFGFVFGVFGGWLRDDLDVGPLVPFGLVMGAVFAVAGLIALLWEREKAREG